MSKIFTLTFLMMFIFCSAAFAEDRPPTISVNGEGTIEVAPDRATVTVGVRSQNRDAGKVQTENAQKASNIVRAIVALGIEKKNIHTGDYNFRPIYRNDENRQNKLVGYTAENSITVTIDDLNLTGKVIDAALSNGANNVNSLSFGIGDRKALEREALKLAARDARAKAEAVAAELGTTIVGIRNVSINSGNVSSPRYKNFAMMEASVAADMSYETPVESGTLNCSASIRVEFELGR